MEETSSKDSKKKKRERESEGEEEDEFQRPDMVREKKKAKKDHKKKRSKKEKKDRRDASDDEELLERDFKIKIIDFPKDIKFKVIKSIIVEELKEALREGETLTDESFIIKQLEGDQVSVKYDKNEISK